MSKASPKPTGNPVSLQTAFSILNSKINSLETKHGAMFVAVERKIGQQDTFVNKIDSDQINTAISEIVDRMLSLLERVNVLEERVAQLDPTAEFKPAKPEPKPEPKEEVKAKAEPKKKRGTVKLEELDTSIGISFSN